MKQKLWICFLAILSVIPVLAQNNTELQGKLIDTNTNEPIIGAEVYLQESSKTTKTDENGFFHFMSVQAGEDIIGFKHANILGLKEIHVNIEHGKKNDLGQVKLNNRNAISKEFVGIIDESLLLASEGDSEGLAQDVSTMVIFSNDIFLKNAGYQFFPYRFRIRGYGNEFQEKYINGVSFNEQVRGVFNYSSIGALNNITRNGNATNYFAPASYSFSDIGGSENINMRAGSYKRGSKITLSLTNRNYYSRVMANYSTGMQDNGWAFMGAIGGRYSHEGSIEGTFYNNLSYAFGVEKEWNEGKHSLSLVTFGSPVERGAQGGSFQEVYDLVDNNRYNPNWGYQNGKKRNARVVKSFDPTAILSHIWKINDESSLKTGVGIHYNKYGKTRLNWYNGPDPRPDYYRYLPSYYNENPQTFKYYQSLWQNKEVSQIDWDNLWKINHINALKGNGSAIYMLEEQHKDLFETAFNSTFNTRISENIKLTAGIGFKHSLAKQFKTVDDLLGAGYVLDVDKFAERDFPGEEDVIQNDLNSPNRIAREGDIFGYNFRYHINSADVWVQQQHEYRNLDFYYGMKLKYTGFKREGKMKNGRYPDNSFGKGEQHNFMGFETKAGLTYKFNGRHFLTGNFSYQQKAPLVKKVYVSPNITDKTVDNMKSLGIFSADINYIFSLPSLSGRIGVFNTNFYDDMMHISYYHDAERTFINHTLTGVNKTHRGVELGMNYKINKRWSLDFVGTAAEYYYSKDPTGIINYENGKKQNIKETVYLDNYFVGGMPQLMGSLGINFFYNYWFFNLNINGIGANHIQVAPLRRLASNYEGLLPPGVNGYDAKKYSAYTSLTHQERFDASYTLDLSIGKILYLKNRKSMNFNLTINNLLNDTDVRTGGYESGRTNLDYPDRFTSKYFYLQGINAFFNVSYNF